MIMAAACSSGSPYGDTVDADVDSAWLLSHADAAGPTTDALVLANLDGGAPQGTAEGGADGGDASATGDGGGGPGTPVPDATAPPEASTDAPADATGGGEATPPACTLTSCGARSVCTGGQCVLARRVFVSSATYTGNLGGYSGADGTCQHLASKAGLGGAWMSWICDSTSCPADRFTPANDEYALLDGTVVAASYKGLVSGTLLHGIDEDEHGQPVGGGTTETWTATNPDGTFAGDGCYDFSSGSHGAPIVVVGVAGNTDATWTSVYLQYCDRTDHLYCVEQ
jgi:hypothetical protein